MLRSMELQLEVDAIQKRQRDEYAALRAASLASPAAGETPEQRAAGLQERSAAIDAIDAEHAVKVAALREAEAAEQRELEELKTRVGAGDMATVSAELREALRIESRASLGTFLESSLDDIQLVGPEAEYRASLLGDDRNAAMPNPIPWPMFLEPGRLAEIRKEQVEARAVITSPASFPAMQDPIIQDVFAASTAAFLGTRFSGAGIGDVVEVVLTSTGATLVAGSGAHTAGGTLTATTLTPRRITTKYELQVEQMARTRGLESAIRADIPRAIMAQIDNEVLNRGGANRFTNGILRSMTLPTTETNTTNTLARALAKVYGGIDGKFARSPKEIKTVVGPETMRLWASNIASNTAVSTYDYLMMHSGGIMSTDHIDVHDTGNQYGIVCKTGPGMMGNIAAKLWGGGVQIKRDDSSGAVAAKGEVHITGLALADFAVLRTAGFTLYDVETV